MMKWHVVFDEEPQTEDSRKGGQDSATAAAEFDQAAKMGVLDGRKVKGMWLIDHGAEQADVIRVFGSAPPSILVRHEAWKRCNP